VREVVNDDVVEVKLEPWDGRGEPGAWNTPTFTALEEALAVLDPSIVSIPSRTPGTMDARYFSEAGLEIYRFWPFVAPSSERERIHGVDERISVENIERGVVFYGALAQRL